MSFFPQRGRSIFENLFDFDFSNNATNWKRLINYDRFNIVAGKHTTPVFIFFFTR